MEKNIKLTTDMINAVYDHIGRKNNMTDKQVCNYITENSNINKQTREEYILNYYYNIVLKDDKNNINNANNGIDNVDKVNFEELTETDKKVIASRKYMCHDYVKEIVYKLNELINKDLSNDRRAVDEAGVVMYAIQAIDRDVANAVSDCQKVLKLMKSKCS